MNLTFQTRFLAVSALVLAGVTGWGEESSEQTTTASQETPETPSEDQQFLEAEYNDEVSRDFPLRSLGSLKVTNRRGSITVRGWNQNKVRVIAKRTVLAPDEDEARKRLAHSGFQYKENAGHIELSAEYGRGLGIEEKIRERKSPKTRMELVVRAPSGLPLHVWGLDEAVQVLSWTSDVSVRSFSGTIKIQSVRASNVSLNCPSCNVFLSGVKSSVRVMGGAGRVDLKRVRGGDVFVETEAGNLDVARVEAKQIYVSKSGVIQGHDLKGRVEFQSGNGNVDLKNTEGFISGKSEAGNISVGVRRWKFEDKSLIESETGNILLTLPSSFSGEVDVWSVSGSTQLDFPLVPLRRKLKSSNVEKKKKLAENRVRGFIGDGGEQLKVFSKKGNIQIRKGI